MHTLTLGDVSISRIVEIGRSSFPTAQMLPESDAGRIASHHRWIKPHFFDEVTGDLGSRIQTWIVRTPRHTVVVDTGIGNDKDRGDNALWNRRRGGLLDDLAAAGVTPEQVDLVLCTHLHVDHVGWNTRLAEGRWLPTFPNARYLIGRAEFDYWKAEEDAREDHSRSPFHDSVAPVFEAGLVDLVETDHRVCDEVSLEPTLGHTPGHVSIRLRSKGQEALITGDFTHHPCQLAHPEWASSADYDAVASTATRKRMYGALAGAQTLVIGTHFSAPTAGRIVADGQVWRFAV